MLLSKKTSIKVSREYANLIGHMCYAASKLWNVCNYERQHYKETGMAQYPDWYYQKKAHKEDLWYKQLPSQTAQEVWSYWGQIIEKIREESNLYIK